MFKEALERAVTGTDGGIAGLLMDFEGIPLESYAKEGAALDLEVVGAEVSVVVKAIQRATEMLDAGATSEVSFRSDKMVTLIRGDGDHYTAETGLAPLGDVANNVKKLPREWINEDGHSMNFQFMRYAQPLIQGEVTIPHDSGVPVFARLDRVRVDKQLPAYEV